MSSTDTLVTAFLATMFIGLIFMLSQVAMREINPSGTQLYDCSKDILNGVVEGSPCAGVTFNGTIRTIALPSTDTTTSPTTGDIITDTLSAAKNWLSRTLGLEYVYDLMKAPMVFLNSMGVPSAVSTSITAIWYFIILFLLVSWMLGR